MKQDPQHDLLSVYSRKEVKPTPQERINIDRTAELYGDRSQQRLVSNKPYSGNWAAGRVL